MRALTRPVGRWQVDSVVASGWSTVDCAATNQAWNCAKGSSGNSLAHDRMMGKGAGVGGKTGTERGSF